MVDRPEPLEAGRVLSLARSDRAAATRALAELPLEHQVALVCESPPQRRAEILGLLPQPELVVPLLPEAELCFAVKAIGVVDAVWLLELATPEQVVACVDLDAWKGARPDRAVLDGWLDALAATDEESLLRSARALDPELLVFYLRWRVDVSLKPADDNDWQPPEGGQTLDGQFYLVARSENDDLSATVTLLRTLFQRDYWTYFRMLQGAIWELDAENEEWALRWRAGRLEDLGFPPWDEAMALYGYLAPERMADVSADLDALDVGEWHLPVWMPNLPVGPDAREGLFRAIAQLSVEERSASFYSLLGTANKVAVADQLPLSDAESIPQGLAKAVRLIDAGLDFVARERGLDPTDVVRRVAMDRLFRIGANLDPGARPRLEPSEEPREEGPKEEGPTA